MFAINTTFKPSGIKKLIGLINACTYRLNWRWSVMNVQMGFLPSILPCPSLHLTSIAWQSNGTNFEKKKEKKNSVGSQSTRHDAILPLSIRRLSSKLSVGVSLFPSNWWKLDSGDVTEMRNSLVEFDLLKCHRFKCEKNEPGTDHISWTLNNSPIENLRVV